MNHIELQEKIIDLIRQIEDVLLLKIIYRFVLKLHKSTQDNWEK